MMITTLHTSCQGWGAYERVLLGRKSRLSGVVSGPEALPHRRPELTAATQWSEPDGPSDLRVAELSRACPAPTNGRLDTIRLGHCHGREVVRSCLAASGVWPRFQDACADPCRAT